MELSFIWASCYAWFRQHFPPEYWWVISVWSVLCCLYQSMYLPYRPLCTKGRATDFAGISFFCKTSKFLQIKKKGCFCIWSDYKQSYITSSAILWCSLLRSGNLAVWFDSLFSIDFFFQMVQYFRSSVQFSLPQYLLVLRNLVFFFYLWTWCPLHHLFFNFILFPAFNGCF